MKFFAIIFFLLVLSCANRSDENKLDYFSETEILFDTLIIRSNNEIIYLNSEIKGSNTSKDKIHLYNFNPFDNTLEKVNLNELRLEKKLPFEKDGPNGTNFIGYMKIPIENYILINGQNKSELFNFKGEKLKTIHYENYSLGWDQGEQVLIPSPLLDPNFDRLYVLLKNELKKSYALGILDIESYEINKIPLDSFQGFNDYTFVLKILGSKISVSQRLYLDMFDEKIVLSSQVSSELLVYDTDLDTFYLKSNKSQLNADRKVGVYKMEHESEESWIAEYSRFHQEITYLQPFWDEKNQVFYRFSFKELPSESKEEDHIKSKIYLSALDKNLNLIGEVYIPELNKKPENPSTTPFPKHFAKDGKVWIYENINDEMGFVVLSFNN